MNAIAIFYTQPFALTVAMECFVKALASFHDSGFDPFKYKHHISDIVKNYILVIPIFDLISKDHFLMGLIKEYENTLHTKFGTTYVQIDPAEAKFLLDTACSIRSEILKVSGLDF